MNAKRERYTPNDVGPSPLEWSAPRLSEVSTLITNGFVGTATPFYTDSSGVPYLYGTNVRANKLEDSGIRFVTHEFHESQSKTSLKVGDLLTVQSGHIGETAVVTEKFEGANCHALIVTRLKQNKAYPEYLSYYINSEIGRARMKGLEVGSTILHINTKDLKKFRVLLPSVPEQRKIAAILSTWDKAITTTEQLLANSQQQKKALMQQLLTGKKRLVDENGVRFNGEWKEYSLAELFEFKKGKGLSKSDLSDNGKTKCVLYGELYTRYPEVIKKVLSRTDNDSGTLSCRGDILIPSSTTTSGIDLANATAILESNVMLGGDINILRAKNEISASFYAHLLTHIKKHEIASRAQGITIIHLYGSDLKGIKVLVPEDIFEQQKIASVLTTADEEISALKQKIEALKQEKKALMQQLLTGKRRVKVDEVAA